MERRADGEIQYARYHMLPRSGGEGGGALNNEIPVKNQSGSRTIQEPQQETSHNLCTNLVTGIGKIFRIDKNKKKKNHFFLILLK